MTDWAVQSVIFISKTTRKNYPNTTLKLLQILLKIRVVSKFLLCIYLTDGF